MKSLLLAIAVLVSFVVPSVSAAEVILTSEVGVGVFMDAREAYPAVNLGTFHRTFDSIPVSLAVQMRDSRWMFGLSVSKESLGTPGLWEEGLEKGRNSFQGDFNSMAYEVDLSARYRIGAKFAVGGGVTIIDLENDQRYPGCCSEEYINGTIRSIEHYRYLAPKISVSFQNVGSRFRYSLVADAYPWLRRSDHYHSGLMGKAKDWGTGVISHGNGGRLRAAIGTQISKKVSIDLSYQVRKTWIDDGSRLFSWEHKRFHNTTDNKLSLGFSYRL